MSSLLTFPSVPGSPPISLPLIVPPLSGLGQMSFALIPHLTSSKLVGNYYRANSQCQIRAGPPAHFCKEAGYAGTEPTGVEWEQTVKASIGG